MAQMCASLFLCGGFHSSQQSVQVGAGEIAAVDDYGGDFLSVADIVKRVGVEQHEIGELARLDGAQTIGDSKKCGGIESGSLQGLHGGEAGGNEMLQFFMQAESGEDVDAGSGVGSS